MRLVEILLIPAALAIAPAAALAAPTSPGGNANEVRTGIETTPVYHRGYRHDRYYYRHRPYYRPYYGHRYYYGPRCYWSRYWHRTVCR